MTMLMGRVLWMTESRNPPPSDADVKSVPALTLRGDSRKYLLRGGRRPPRGRETVHFYKHLIMRRGRRRCMDTLFAVRWASDLGKHGREHFVMMTTGIIGERQYAPRTMRWVTMSVHHSELGSAMMIFYAKIISAVILLVIAIGITACTSGAPRRVNGMRLFSCVIP